VSYALQNAFFQWEEGQLRIRQADPRAAAGLEAAVDLVVEELRRRLGSSFTLEELADLYAAGADWAHDLARSRMVSGDASWAVDAAFARYSREAADYAGGRARD
jgi:hypothetical protein